MNESKKHNDDETSSERMRSILRILYDGNPDKVAIMQKLPKLSLEELKLVEELIDKVNRGEE